MSERVRATWYDVVRAQGVSERDAETIRGAFLYEGFCAKAAGREKAPYSGLFASHGSVAVTRRYRTTAGRQTDFAGRKMTATRPKAPIIQGSRDTGT
jgi:hypothetical protein